VPPGVLQAILAEKSLSFYENFSFGACINRSRPIAQYCNQSASSMPPGVKPFSEVEKRAAIKLWKAGIPLKKTS
jgi:hypothetical protein